MKKWILSLAVLFTATTSFAALEAMDGQETHGGNIVISEFWSRHNFVTTTLAQCPTAHKNELVSMWLNNTRKTDVRSSWRVFIGAKFDQEVVASNSPKADPPSIFISESLWPKLNEVEKTKIVMHEVLPILGYVDTAYDYSTNLYTVFFDCLVPTTTHANLVRTFVQCDERYIENWGPIEMSILRPHAMSSALFHSCLPAVKKLISYGFSIGGCNTDDIPERHDSYMSSAIVGYYPGNARSEAILDFILEQKTSDLAAECDPQFAMTCKYLANRTTGLDKPQKLVALSKKLSCQK